MHDTARQKRVQRETNPPLKCCGWQDPSSTFHRRWTLLADNAPCHRIANSHQPRTVADGSTPWARPAGCSRRFRDRFGERLSNTRLPESRCSASSVAIVTRYRVHGPRCMTAPSAASVVARIDVGRARPSARRSIRSRASAMTCSTRVASSAVPDLPVFFLVPVQYERIVLSCIWRIGARSARMIRHRKRRKVQMRKWIVVAFVLAGLVSAQGPAAATRWETTEMRVRIERLELTSPAAARRLVRRTGDAAQESCGAFSFSQAEFKTATAMSRRGRDASMMPCVASTTPLLTEATLEAGNYHCIELGNCIGSNKSATARRITDEQTVPTGRCI